MSKFKYQYPSVLKDPGTGEPRWMVPSAMATRAAIFTNQFTCNILSGGGFAGFSEIGIAPFAMSADLYDYVGNGMVPGTCYEGSISQPGEDVPCE